MKAYTESHPWITFSALDVNDLPPRTWMLLGEARAICEQITSTPLKPGVVEHLNEIALIKGALATTAIEGNTLNEEQVAGIYRGEYTAPPSREYQEREVRNVLDALTKIDTQATSGSLAPVTAELICDYNFQVLNTTEHAPDAAPGEFRDHSVMAGHYRGAPAQDCPYLTRRLAEWLESDMFRSDHPDTAFALTVIQAIYAHLYIAWIHPFGDGNGRTARLLEFMLLARSGQLPLLAAHLLSNHYNLTPRPVLPGIGSRQQDKLNARLPRVRCSGTRRRATRANRLRAHTATGRLLDQLRERGNGPIPHQPSQQSPTCLGIGHDALHAHCPERIWQSSPRR